MIDATLNTTRSRDTQVARVAPHADWLLAALIAGPILVIVGKLEPLPTAPLFNAIFSVNGLPAHVQRVVADIFFVPVGALMVVLFREMLGLKVLGFFRPILIAIAFASVGVLLGTACLVFFLAFIAAVRPRLAGAPYYTRVPVLLSLVAATLVTLVIVGSRWHLQWLEEAAYFPVIALCLSCESFAKSLARDGVAEASWRAIVTVIAALAISAVTALPSFTPFMSRMPELLFLEAAVVLLVARHLRFRWFEGWNPLARRSHPSLDDLADREERP
jgi:hypothetical protein